MEAPSQKLQSSTQRFSRRISGNLSFLSGGMSSQDYKAPYVQQVGNKKGHKKTEAATSTATYLPDMSTPCHTSKSRSRFLSQSFCLSTYNLSEEKNVPDNNSTVEAILKMHQRNSAASQPSSKTNIQAILKMHKYNSKGSQLSSSKSDTADDIQMVSIALDGPLRNDDGWSARIKKKWSRMAYTSEQNFCKQQNIPQGSGDVMPSESIAIQPDQKIEKYTHCGKNVVSIGTKSAKKEESKKKPANNSPLATNSTHRYTDYSRVPSGHLKLYSPKRGGVSIPFPIKLHYILTTAQKDTPISWRPHGRSFMVTDTKRFATEILTNIFRQTKMSSFRRQLNLYGFQRINKGPEAGSYYHEYFLKYRPDICLAMQRTRVKREVKGDGLKKTVCQNDDLDFYSMEPIAQLKEMKTHPTSKTEKLDNNDKEKLEIESIIVGNDSVRNDNREAMDIIDYVQMSSLSFAGPAVSSPHACPTLGKRRRSLRLSMLMDDHHSQPTTNEDNLRTKPNQPTKELPMNKKKKNSENMPPVSTSLLDKGISNQDSLFCPLKKRRNSLFLQENYSNCVVNPSTSHSRSWTNCDKRNTLPPANDSSLPSLNSQHSSFQLNFPDEDHLGVNSYFFGDEENNEIDKHIRSNLSIDLEGVDDSLYASLGLDLQDLRKSILMYAK